MTDMIDELFQGKLDLSMFELKKGSEYYNKRNEIVSLLEALENPETKEKTERVRDALNDLDYVISRAYFTIGFRWGARMALSILSDESDLFVPEA